MATSLTTFDALLKEMYSDEEVANLVYTDHPFLALVPKKEDFGGDALVVPVKYGTNNRVSNTFSDAVGATITTGDTSQTAKFTVTMEEVYGVGNLDRKTIWSAKNAGNMGAFVEHVEFERNDLLDGLGRRIAGQLFRGSSGSLGTIGSIASTVVTLGNAAQAFDFEPGMYVCVSSADGTGSLRDSGASVRVTAVDVDAGTITTASAIDSAISGAVEGDYIFPLGDHAAGIDGLADWVPSSTTGLSNAFYGVTRSVHPSRLAGVRYDASSVNATYEDIFTKLAVDVYRNSKKRSTHLFVPPAVWSDLSKSLQSQVVFSRGSGVKAEKGEASFGFESLKMAGPGGMIDIVADPDCPYNRAYLLALDTWKLVSLGQAPHIQQDDGLLIRNASTDSYNIRASAYANLVCYNPGANGVALLA